MCSEPDVWIDGWKLAASSSRQADQVPAGHTAGLFFFAPTSSFSPRASTRQVRRLMSVLPGPVLESRRKRRHRRRADRASERSVEGYWD